MRQHPPEPRVPKEQVAAYLKETSKLLPQYLAKEEYVLFLLLGGPEKFSLSSTISVNHSDVYGIKYVSSVDLQYYPTSLNFSIRSPVLDDSEELQELFATVPELQNRIRGLGKHFQCWLEVPDEQTPHVICKVFALLSKIDLLGKS